MYLQALSVSDNLLQASHVANTIHSYLWVLVTKGNMRCISIYEWRNQEFRELILRRDCFFYLSSPSVPNLWLSQWTQPQQKCSILSYALAPKSLMTSRFWTCVVALVRSDCVWPRLVKCDCLELWWSSAEKDLLFVYFRAFGRLLESRCARRLLKMRKRMLRETVRIDDLEALPVLKDANWLLRYTYLLSSKSSTARRLKH